VVPCRALFANFLEDTDTKRLLVFLDGKDLGAVSNWMTLLRSCRMFCFAVDVCMYTVEATRTAVHIGHQVNAVQNMITNVCVAGVETTGKAEKEDGLLC
jgi:hypothetical protein